MNVVILRGIPGSGKSTWAERQQGRKIICSADHFHIVNGEYLFNPAKAGEAHNDCLHKFLSFAMEASEGRGRTDLLIVDNTNTTAWEISPYYRLAEVYGLSVSILNFYCEILTSFQRNIHKVPIKTIAAIHRNMLVEVLPSHWKQEYLFGWEDEI